MKKTLGLVLAGCCILLVTGCGGDKTLNCSRTMNQNGIKADLKYEVTYSGDTVKKVKSTEKITSDSEDALKTYKDSIEATYAPYKNIEHYNYNVAIDGKTLTSTAEINYEKIDTAKMIEVDSANSQLIKDGKVSLKDLKAAYKSVGATCEK